MGANFIQDREIGLLQDLLDDYEILQLHLTGELVVAGNAGGTYLLCPGYVYRLDVLGNPVQQCCFEITRGIGKLVSDNDMIIACKLFIETEESRFRKEVMSSIHAHPSTQQHIDPREHCLLATRRGEHRYILP